MPLRYVLSCIVLLQMLLPLDEAVVSHLEGEDAGAGAHQVAHGAAAAHQVVPEAAEEAAEPVVVLRNVDNPVVVP